MWSCPFTSRLLSGLEKKCPEDIIAITHDDDLRLVENVVRPTVNVRPDADSNART